MKAIWSNQCIMYSVLTCFSAIWFPFFSSGSSPSLPSSPFSCLGCVRACVHVCICTYTLDFEPCPHFLFYMWGIIAILSVMYKLPEVIHKIAILKSGFPSWERKVLHPLSILEHIPSAIMQEANADLMVPLWCVLPFTRFPKGSVYTQPCRPFLYLSPLATPHLLVISLRLLVELSTRYLHFGPVPTSISTHLFPLPGSRS